MRSFRNTAASSHAPLAFAVALTAFTLGMATSAPLHAAEPLAGKHVAFLVGEGVHDGETFMPMAYLVNRGAKVTILGVKPGNVTAYNSDYQVTVQKAVSDASVADFDALVIPGGRSPAFLREHEAVVDFTRDFFAAGKPVAAICHGPQVLVKAGVMEGLRATSVSGISEELSQAGASYVDKAVVQDRNLITSRLPKDLPDFSRAIESSLVEPGATAR